MTPEPRHVDDAVLADGLSRSLKAGGYAVQGYGEVYVRHLAGSYSNVVGLPLAETRHLRLAADQEGREDEPGGRDHHSDENKCQHEPDTATYCHFPPRG